MSEFKREARYIVVKPDCEDSLRTERLKSYIDEMCFKTPDCVVVEADWPEYEPVWRMIENRVMGLPDELECAQSELAALREELAEEKKWFDKKEFDLIQQRLADAERRNESLSGLLRETSDYLDGSTRNAVWCDSILHKKMKAALTKPEEAKS